MFLEKYEYKMIENSIKKTKLLPAQKEALEYMINGKNIFITGPGGVGKTHLIKIYKDLYSYKKNIAVTSTTGISAILIGGSTLFSYLGIGLGTNSLEYLHTMILKNKYIYSRWLKLEVLIIDEISMLSPELFDKLENLARLIRRNKEFFGGIQIILFGDFLQLPPVKNSDNFCFESKSWKYLDKIIYLKDIVRQTDTFFKNCLTKVRLGIIDDEVKKILNSRLNKEIVNKYGIKPTQLLSTNSDVDYINENELDILSEEGKEFFEYKMETSFYDTKTKTKTNVIEKIKNNCNAVDTLQLCLGAQVMLLCNLDIENELVNGSRGIVVDFIDDLPVIQFMNGIKTTIDYHIWEIEENDKKIMKIIQIPLKLAWAITFHKSQGQTLDCVIMDLGKIFEYGQAYIGLSRVKTLEGMTITDIDYDKIIASPKALQFYNNL